MKALLPPYCRLMGYAVLLASIFAPFILVMFNVITDANLLFAKECFKLAMMLGLLMVLLAYAKNENEETGRIRIKAMRYAVFITAIYLFINTLIVLHKGDPSLAPTSSFLIFLAINTICQEFGIIKASVDKMFLNRRKRD